MAILNIDFTINRTYTIKSIKNIMEQVMENYFDDEKLVIKIENKKKLFNNIIKEKIEFIKSASFWYLNGSNNKCTHIYKKGKNEGFMCQKTIRTNLDGQKQDFLCCTHSKKHTPKKRKLKTNISNDKSFYNLNNKINNIKYYKDKKKYIKIIKIYICNSGIMDLSNVLKQILY
jgi:hypothetical protein